MNHKSKQILKFFLFFVVSAFLFWLVYRDQNFGELMEVLKEDVDYKWAWFAAIGGILSHMARALRWQLLTASMGHHIRFMNSFMGVMIGYFANLAIPRMGEFTRCGVVSRYEKMSFSKLLGTVLAERVIDLLILLSLILVVLVTQFKQIGIFLDNNQGVKENLIALLHSWWVLVFIAICVVAFVIIRRVLRGTQIRAKLSNFWAELKEGLLTVKNVKQRGLFIFYSLFIWLMYFLMLYLCFFCFEFTSHLGMLVGLTIFVLGSFGMLAPVQGGIGAWHFMTIAGLMVYLPDVVNIEGLSKAFALLTHGLMTLLYIIVGVICVIALPIYNAHVNKKKA
ncbi:flippase-like domain-containing protein [Porphyromonadaceae bacterium OttesenSCG-928-L07]|nr:flippase-like domain-containing protein [Porphyromonadaceae bacterium OttesenSCG-928-L07]